MATKKRIATARPASTGDSGVPLQQAMRPRICFERIIPDELDPERHVRHALRGQIMSTAGNGKLKPEEVARITRMAIIVSKKWGKDSVLRCRFLDGTSKMRQKVRKVARAG